MAEKTLSLGIEYLGFLNSQLRDLHGYSVLANELIQNADDAPGATQVLFDVRDDALVVENDGVFSDCDHMELRDCPWLQRKEAKSHRCDFHRFRQTASGDKRRQENTIGAFGIGFIAVYQVTDRPELLSGERHWLIRPDYPMEDRIKVFSPPGDAGIGTKFVLPWAQDSDLREAFGVESITTSDIQDLLENWKRVLPGTLLFLRNISRIDLRRNGETLKTIERICEDNTTLVDERGDDSSTRLWYLFGGEFAGEAKAIRRRVGKQIEDKRQHEVTIAIPQLEERSDNIRGLLHAYLPTQYSVGLPFHINADFYTSSDRKQVLFTQDYQGDWNRAAIRASARAISAILPEIRELLGFDHFWRLLKSLRDLAKDVENTSQEPIFASFWQMTQPHLQDLRIVFTTEREWCTLGEAVLLRNKDEEETSIPILESIGLRVVNLELNAYSNLLREIGVSYLQAMDLAQSLKDAGLDRSLPLQEAPTWIQSPQNRVLLSTEIGILLGRRGARNDLGSCAIALSQDGLLCPPSLLRHPTSEVLETFGPLAPKATFVSSKNPPDILNLVPDFGIADAIQVLEKTPHDLLVEFWRSEPDQYLEILIWFAERPAEVRASPHNISKLSKLKIWPAEDNLYSVSEVVVPGGFTEPLALASVVAPSVAKECGSFLKEELEARSLTLETYVIEYLPQAFVQTEQIEVDRLQSLVGTLAHELGHLRDNTKACSTLRGCPIVECIDGAFRRADHVYFDTELVKSVLGEDISVALLPSRKQGSVRELLKWLGVASVPRPHEIVQRIDNLIEDPPQGDVREEIQTIFSHMGAEWKEVFAPQADKFSRLKQISWLPVVGDNRHWFKPDQIFATFSRHLFATQAQFLDIRNQTRYSDFVDFLGIPSQPRATQVVRHLLHKAKNNEVDLNTEVYGWLDQHVGAAEITKLRSVECLLLDDEQYVHPHKVYWTDHPFWRYRFKLSSKFRKWASLLEALGVRDKAAPKDAVEVLKDISAEVGHRHVDENTYKVILKCWRMLSSGLENESIKAEDLATLREVEVVPDNSQYLQPPKWTFFEDRPGLKQRFPDFFSRNVIPRPQGAWKAMEAAGVRPLSEVITSKLIKCDNPVISERLQSYKDERSHLISWVLETQNIVDRERSLLENIELKRVQSLKIAFTANAFNRTQTSSPEPTSAYFDAEADIIYFQHNGDIPWSAIARELAYALSPRTEAGLIAPALKEILRNDSTKSAETELSELGFAPWRLVEDMTTPKSAEVDPGGMERSEVLLDGQSSETREEGSKYESSTETQNLRDGEKQHPAASQKENESQEQVAKASKRTSASKRSRLRTYVTHGSVSSTKESHERKEKWSKTDAAGVKKVIAFERRDGRFPHEMPHDNPGYDIESKDEKDQVVRYIEVKSTAGKWKDTGVALTSTQFSHARKRRERFWLYVVERAERDDFRIYTIQDPAQRVDQFFYDDGWKDIAFDDERNGSLIEE